MASYQSLDSISSATPAAVVGWIKRATERINQILLGRLNNTGTAFSLTINVTSTQLQDARLTGASIVTLEPTTANAAGALGGLYFTNKLRGSVTVNHANNSQADRTFNYTITG